MAYSPSSVRSLSPEFTETIQIFVKNIAGDSKSLHSATQPPTAEAALHNLSHLQFTACNPQLTTLSVIPMTVPSDLTVENLTTLLSARTSLPTSDLRLVYAGRHLSPSSTLAESHITRDSTIHLASPLRGGMPPKKIRCSYKDCREGAQRIIGDCGFCNGHFCGKHRLLEDHKCDGLEDVSWPSDHDSISALFSHLRRCSSALTSSCENVGDDDDNGNNNEIDLMNRQRDEENIQWWLVGLDDENLITDILRDEQCKKQSHERNAAQLNAERTQVIKGI
ncbi:hypothetical protein B7463_g7201, partial [Scytalidium lignicola]